MQPACDSGRVERKPTMCQRLFIVICAMSPLSSHAQSYTWDVAAQSSRAAGLWQGETQPPGEYPFAAVIHGLGLPGGYGYTPYAAWSRSGSIRIITPSSSPYWTDVAEGELLDESASQLLMLYQWGWTSYNLQIEDDSCPCEIEGDYTWQMFAYVIGYLATSSGSTEYLATDSGSQYWPEPPNFYTFSIEQADF